MSSMSRRDFLCVSVAAGAGLARRADSKAPEAKNVHEQLLDLAAEQQKKRRARFTAVKSQAELGALQKDLRQKLLDCIGGLPAKTEAPPAKKVGRVEGEDYLIEKLVFQSLPNYFVPALLYRPKKVDATLPGVVSPCGHLAEGKADETYQKLHVNLAAGI